MTRITLLVLCALLTGASVDAASTRQEMGRTLRTTQIDELKVRQAEVADVVRRITEELREKKAEVNIVLLEPDKERPPVTLDLKKTSALDTLVILCRMTGLRMEVERGILFLRDD